MNISTEEGCSFYLGRNVWQMTEVRWYLTGLSLVQRNSCCSHSESIHLLTSWKQADVDDWRDRLIIPLQCSFHSLFCSESPSRVSVSVSAVFCPDDTVNLSREAGQLAASQPIPLQLQHQAHSPVPHFAHSNEALTSWSSFLTLRLWTLPWEIKTVDDSSALWCWTSLYVSVSHSVRLTVTPKVNRWMDVLHAQTLMWRNVSESTPLLEVIWWDCGGKLGRWTQHPHVDMCSNVDVVFLFSFCSVSVFIFQIFS